MRQGAVSTRPVMVNQLGYVAGATKIAVVLSPASSPGSMEIIDANGTVVWTGGPTTVRAADQNSGDAVHHADFSVFSTVGMGYRLRVTIGGSALESERFDIGDDLFAQARLAQAATKYFNWKRSGMAVAADSEFNIAGHGLSHAGDSTLYAYGGWNSATFDVAGGWYDAGDFGKYLESHTAATWQLGNLFERLKGRPDPNGVAIEDLDLGINDSALPDLLDELAWGTRWVRGTLPRPTTHIANPIFTDLASNKVAANDWAPWVSYEDDPGVGRACMGPSSSATHSAARNLAMVSRLLRPYGSVQTIVDLDSNNLSAAAYADKLWAAAQEAFGRATGKHPGYADYSGAQAANMLRSDLDMAQSPGFNQGSGAYGDEDMLDDEYAAAVELYLTACARGDAAAVQTYKPIVTGHTYYKVAGPCDWGSERELGDPDGEETGCAMLSLLAAHDSVCTGSHALAPADLDAIRANLAAYADTLVANLSGQNYPFYAPDGGQVVWGSNGGQAGAIVTLNAAYENSGNKAYLYAAYRLMDYLLGVNPMRTSYIIGFGDAAEAFTHDRAMKATGGWVRGTLVGGPHNVDEFFDDLANRWGGGPGIDDPVTPDSGPALKRYAATDDGSNSWESKENAVNWNGALANAVWSLNVHARDLGCESDADCADANRCTTDTCQAGVCRNDAILCDDSRVCTTDQCDPATGQCNYDDTACCATEQGCSDGTACTRDICSADELCQNPDRGVCCVNVGQLSPVGATASSSEHGGLLPDKAIDGDYGSRWSSAFADDQWIVVDLGFITYVQRVVLRWETAASARYDIDVARAADGPWTTIFTETAGNGGVDDIDANDGLTPAAGRYVRMYGHTRTTPYGHSLWEIEIFGDPDPNCYQTTIECGDRSCDPPESCTTCPSDCCSGGAQCTSHGDCDDQNVCTTDVCVEGTCTYSHNTEPCADDGSTCTDDVCSGGLCTHPSNGTCECMVHADCDDLNVCTTDECIENACSYSHNTGPCADDGDPCTDDICEAGLCTHPDNGTCPTCGDGVCESGEDCQSCPDDCGPCPACGNGVCESGEDCQSCPADCGACPSSCTCRSGCDALVPASVDLIHDGPGTICFFFSGSLGNFVNSWNNVEVNLNGLDITNQWLGAPNYPDRIDGGYYLFFNGNFPWSHVEVRN